MSDNKKTAVSKPAITTWALQPASASSVRMIRGKFGLNPARCSPASVEFFPKRPSPTGSPVNPWRQTRKLRRIKELDQFPDRLSEVVSPEAIPSWLDAPNDAFEGLKPLEVIERGEIDRLWDMIFYLESGVAS